METEFDPGLRKKFVVEAKSREVDAAQVEIGKVKNAPNILKGQSNE